MIDLNLKLNPWVRININECHISFEINYVDIK
jgi:hypothetical protein